MYLVGRMGMHHLKKCHHTRFMSFFLVDCIIPDAFRHISLYINYLAYHLRMIRFTALNISYCTCVDTYTLERYNKSCLGIEKTYRYIECQYYTNTYISIYDGIL